ncbi:MAG: hydroxymethylpyrimidine/phosphomethylpyrimidine kinase [Oxalobacteraceae bacterium]|jgi:hydroxymethylpyrimidine/phosphomethylpyrimidine kinase|nr:hydroxymethylpyrimidine/phosphomethylpyrimidine kinase [Oxalobacteraceae bacterium]
MKKVCVLVFAGLDPSGGAGIQADIQAISDAGAHPLTIITALTVQDNQHVHAVHPVTASILFEQAHALIAQGTAIDAIKIGIVGSLANAQAIAKVIITLKAFNPGLPVVLDPVLASGHGDVLTQGDAVQAIAPLRSLATLILPNLPEARALCDGVDQLALQAQRLLQDTPHVMIKGGHGEGDDIINTWFHGNQQREWHWPRLLGEYHGSGCTLASAIAARFAQGVAIEAALDAAQNYTHNSLAHAYAIAPGQHIPHRLKEMS